MLLHSLMRSSVIEVHHISFEETVELLFMKDEEVIQAFSPHASQKAFTDAIRSWSLVRCSKHFDTACCCHSCKTLPEFAIIIPDQILWGFPIWRGLPQLLRDPGIGGRACHIDMDPPSVTSARVMKKAKSGRKKRSGPGGNHRPIALPHGCAGTFSSSVLLAVWCERASYTSE